MKHTIILILRFVLGLLFFVATVLLAATGVGIFVSVIPGALWLFAWAPFFAKVPGPMGEIWRTGLLSTRHEKPIPSGCPFCKGKIFFYKKWIGAKCPSCKNRYVIRSEKAYTPEEAKKLSN